MWNRDQSADGHVLTVHRDGGITGYATNGGAPTFAAGIGLPLTADAFDHVSSVRILGVRANAPLFLAVRTAQLLGHFRGGATLMVAGPQVCGPPSAHADPGAVLHRLWAAGGPGPRRGPWYTASARDDVNYALIAAVDGEVLVPGGADADTLLARHPAYPALSFLAGPSGRGIDRAAARRLLAHVVDPRWYRHPSRPGRLSPLFAHLGLSRANALAWHGDGPPGRHYERMRDAVAAWRPAAAPPHGYAAPDAFLWRTAAAAPDPATGLLRATRRLVAFLFHVWAGALAPPHPEVGFRPDLFFGDEAERSAYARHAAAT